MDYDFHKQNIILKVKAYWRNLGWNRSFGWLIIIVFLIMLCGILYALNTPLKTNSYHESFMKIANHRKLEDNFIKKEAAKFERKNAKMDTSKLTEVEIKATLINVFNKADTNNDEVLDLKELTNLISEKVRDHLTIAIKENFFIFTAIDQNPRNGAVSWDEYIHYILRQNRFTDSEIKKYKSSLQGLPRELKVRMMKDQTAFGEAAKEDPDRLSIDEFLSFRHPESSHSTILSYVEETLFKYDLNSDGIITEKEFTDPELKEEDLGRESLENYKKERIKEFRDVLDKDKNGKVIRNELVQYYDPRHIHHSEKEAHNLMSMGDINEDGYLSLAEMLMNKENFMNSKLVNVAKSFHDEF